MLKLKKGATFLTTNITNIDDCLIDGQLGTVFDFRFTTDSRLQTVYIKSHYKNVRMQARKLKQYTHENNNAPVARIETSFTILGSKLSSSVKTTMCKSYSPKECSLLWVKQKKWI